MSASPPLSPRQRRRILRAHQLRQRGATIRAIAHQLDTSPSTIHNDLRTLEQHWQPILQHAARDALTAQIADLQDDIALYRSAVPIDLDQQRLQRSELAALRRELRLTAAALNGHPQTPEEEAPADYPDHELADQLAEPDRTQPNTIEHHRTESNTHNRPDQIGTPSPTAQQEKIPEQRLPATNAAAASASPANRTAKTPPAAHPEPARPTTPQPRHTRASQLRHTRVPPRVSRRVLHPSPVPASAIPATSASMTGEGARA